MKVEVHLTDEEKNATPDFEKRLKRFQYRVDQMSRREIFRLCLHEGGHAWADRKFWCPPTLNGPSVKIKGGEPVFAYGSVAADVSPLPGWMKGAAAVAGYVAVEILTGQPEEPDVIENDNRGHEKSDLGMGEIFIRSELSGSLMELLSAAREYEVTIFGTDDVVLRGVNEFRLFHPGERYAVGIASTGYHGLLMEHNGHLRLFVDGVEYTPKDKINGYEPTLVVPYGAKREGR
jgi:hypothetical protein